MYQLHTAEVSFFEYQIMCKEAELLLSATNKICLIVNTVVQTQKQLGNQLISARLLCWLSLSMISDTFFSLRFVYLLLGLRQYLDKSTTFILPQVPAVMPQITVQAPGIHRGLFRRGALVVTDSICPIITWSDLFFTSVMPKSSCFLTQFAKAGILVGMTQDNLPSLLLLPIKERLRR